MKKLIKRQISEKLNSINDAKPLFYGTSSWIKYMRQALNMTSAQLAKRMNIANSSLHQLERQEAQDKISLQSLKRAAEALDCELIYAIVPRDSLESTMSEQAEKKALKIIKDSKLHMDYEDQAISQKESQKQFEELCEKLKTSKKLWEDS